MRWKKFNMEGNMYNVNWQHRGLNFMESLICYGEIPVYVKGQHESIKICVGVSDNDSTENHQVCRIGCKSEIIIHHDIKVLNKTPPVPIKTEQP